MRNRENQFFKPQNLLILLLISYFVGCAGFRETRINVGSPMRLKYQFPRNQQLTYEAIREAKQTMEIQGQSSVFEVSENHKFKFANIGDDPDHMLLNVRIKEANIQVKGSAVPVSPDISMLVEKDFNMTVNTSGREEDLSGADSITYQFEAGNLRSIASWFQTFFPDVAENAINVADTWTTHDTLTETGTQDNIMIVVERENTLLGFEIFNGWHCAKIASKQTGLMQGTGSSNGLSLIMEGVVHSSGVWYFAFREGVLAGEEIEVTMTGAISSADSDAFSIPFSRTMTTRNNLIPQ